MATPIHNLRQPLTDQEKHFYDSIFKSLDTESLGIVTGETARSTFEKSGLPPAILGEIWQIADPTNLGFLSQFAFSVALRLIGHVQNGAKPDKSLIDYAGPVAKFQGVSGPNVAPVPALAHSSTRSISSPQQLQPQLTSLPPLTNHDISKFSQLFAKSAPTGIISGDQARNIFLKAKLPTNVLSEIWALADKNNRGQLDRDEFVVAMFLIQGTINGTIRQLPPSVPQHTWDQLKNFQSPITTGGSSTAGVPASSFSPQVTASRPNISRVPSSFANASNDWTISPQKRAQFDSIFEGLDKESRGVLGPNEIAPFLTTSKLSQDVLANIWDLSDIHNTGEFTKTEFAIAMFLVQKKIAGSELPHVIPDSLLPNYYQGASTSPTEQYKQQSVPQPGANQSHSQDHAIPQIPSRDTKPKSSLTDLVDLNDAFSTPSPTIAEAKLPEKDASRTASNSTVQYTPAGGAPRPFVPSSTFGQEIFEKQKAEAPKEVAQPPAPGPVQAKSPEAPVQLKESPVESKFAPQFTGSTQQSSSGQVPTLSTGNRAPSFQTTPSFSQQPTGSLNRSLPRNDDLLADSNPEISGQLSQATADMANLSNQIGSLTNQTSQLHEKRGRAEKELAKITTLKKDIEAKLSKLRVAYEQEVQQTQQVETSLKASKEETEQLRKEASVAEAQYNSVQTQLQSLQSELEESQKENASLKERLGTLNAEHIEVQKQLEKVQGDVRQSKGLAAINSKQLSTTEVSSNGIKAEIAALLASIAELDSHHEGYTKKQTELESLKKEIDTNEQSLAQRRQAHEQSEVDFKAKDEELQSRLQEQQQREAQIQQHEAHIQQLFANLQERQRQLENAENQLQEQQVQYAQRVQEFSNRQIEEASNGYNLSSASREIEPSATPAVPPTTSKEAVIPSDLESSTSATRDLDTASSSKDSNTSKGLLGAAVGAVAGAIGGTALAARSATTESERDNTEFSSPVAETTEQTTSVNSDDYQYEAGRDVNQFNLPIERPESATSSVQNNAPQSVRGDDIEENPTIDSVVETPALASDVLSKDYNAGERHQDAVEATTESPDVGSFEIVDEKSESDLTLRPGTGPEQSADAIESSIPGAWNVDSAEAQQENAEAKDPEPAPSVVDPQLRDASASTKAIHEDAIAAAAAATGATDDEVTAAKTDAPVRSASSIGEEFPPIKELNINESESDDEEFHETSENLPDQTKSPSKHTGGAIGAGVGATAGIAGASALGAGNKDFNFETPFAPSKTPEKRVDELFQDDFEGLEAAKEDTLNDDDDEFNQTRDFNEQLDGSNFYGADNFSGQQSQQFSDPAHGQDSNGEWEQIFAGFGNEGQAQQPQEAVSQPPAASSHPYAQNAFGSQSSQQKVIQPEPTHPGRVASSSSSHKHGRIATTPRSLAVQELTGMGFSKEEALAALTKEKWNLEAATNHLLDNA